MTTLAPTWWKFTLTDSDSRQIGGGRCVAPSYASAYAIAKTLSGIAEVTDLKPLHKDNLAAHVLPSHPHSTRKEDRT